MKTQIMLTALLAVSVCLLLPPAADALCCPWVLTPNAKCACQDGGYVHPWECCATGGCNVFCCNCAGDCRGNTTTTTTTTTTRRPHALSKRDADEEDRLKTAAVFVSLDTDGDLGISADEMATFWKASNRARPMDLAAFAAMDSDGDGLIRAAEFDSDLDDDIIRRV